MSEWTADTAEGYVARYGEYATHRLDGDALIIARDGVHDDVGPSVLGQP